MNKNTQTFLSKYEPTALDEVIGQSNIVNILRGYIKNNNIPHLMFAGAPGIGKTTIAKIIARELFGETWESNTIMMNASDERGIEIVRNKIKQATKFSPLNAPFKIIFLDEMEEMTIPAQRAMRDIIVKHQNVTRFIFAVNDISKVIDPILDRAQVFRFKLLKQEDIYNHLQGIVIGEGISINNENINLIAELSGGSMRRGVNALQSVYTQPEINESIIRELMNSTLNNNDINKLLELIKTGNVEIYEKFLFELVYNGGYDPNEIMCGIIDYFIKKNNNQNLSIVSGLAEYSWRMSQGANKLLQLRCGLLKLSQTKIKS